MVHIICRYFILALTALGLSACGSSNEKQASLHGDGPLTPLPSEFTAADPSDSDFMDAIQNYVLAKNAPANTRYEFTRIDLNHDGRREGLVLMKSPHNYWCNINGCAMAVFQATGSDSFALLSEVNPVRGPLTVSTRQTKGWNDIIVRVSGRTGWEAKNVALQYNGYTYPSNPAFEAPIHVADALNISGTRIFP